jgi:hypothetical protein
MGKFLRTVDNSTGRIASRIIDKIQGIILQKINSQASYNYLMNHLGNGMIIPYNSMSISPRAMMVIINHILINDIKTIVEFGSGISTIFLNNLSKKNNLSLNITSVDHDGSWQKKIKEKYNLEQVKFIHAPQKGVIKFKGSDFIWYEQTAMGGIDKSAVDFVIIDGPIGEKSLYERAGAFEFFKSELNRKSFSCLMDDTNFKELKEVMAQYCPQATVYQDFSIYIPGNKYNIEPVLFAK